MSSSPPLPNQPLPSSATDGVVTTTTGVQPLTTYTDTPMSPTTPAAGSTSSPPPASSSPFSSFSPSNYFSDKYDKAKLAINNIHIDTNGLSEKASATVDGLTSPVKAQMDAALSRASAEMKAKLAVVEQELKAKAVKLDADFAQAKSEMKSRYELEKAELEKKYSAQSEAMLAKVKAEYESKKSELSNKALLEFEKVLVKLLDEKVLPEIQKAALDPLMPEVVQVLIVEAIAATWPDVKEEIFDIWANLVLDFEPIPDPDPPPWYYNPFQAMINSFLYNTFPYDRNLWWQLRSFSWWFWLAVSLFPLYGVQAAYFIFLFLLLDKRDEFQMVNFILQFKGLQFITLGIINCMVGAGTYYSCVSINYAGTGEVGYLPVGSNPSTANFGMGYIHNCDTHGPAALPGFYTDMILFLVQNVTIWIAMGLLPSTTKKGLRKLTPNSPPRHFEGSILSAAIPTAPGGITSAPVYAGMGGKLRLMIFWDAFLLFIVCGITVILIFTRPYKLTTSGTFSTYEWLFREDIFWLKTLYGLASAPFVIFLLPLVSNLLLHTRPTGYNRVGECVPLLKRKETAVEAGAIAARIKARSAVGGIQTIQISAGPAADHVASGSSVATSSQIGWVSPASPSALPIAASNKVGQAPIE